jgi:catechol 2,3-dioxygenase-like lactoylglutathione lyase family enzyme
MLRHVLLLQRDVPKAARFYNEGLGLTVNVCTEKWAELQSGAARLALKGVEGCVPPPRLSVGAERARHLPPPLTSSQRGGCDDRLFAAAVFRSCRRHRDGGEVHQLGCCA